MHRSFAAQLGGRELSPMGKNHVSYGQISMTSAQSDGAALGIGVGEQTGGLPSGEGLNIGLSGLHSKAQHLGQFNPGGVGMTSQSGLPMASQFGGRDPSLYGKKQVSYGQRSITSAHSDGAALGILKISVASILSYHTSSSAFSAPRSEPSVVISLMLSALVTRTDSPKSKNLILGGLQSEIEAIDGR